MSDGKVTIEVEVDTSKVKSDIDSALHGLSGKTTDKTIHIKADTSAATSAINTIENRNVSDKTVHVNADTDNATTKLETVENKQVSDKTVHVDADIDNAESKFDTVENVALADKTVNVTADVSTALSAFAEIENYQFSDKNVNVNAGSSGESVSAGKTAETVSGMMGGFLGNTIRGAETGGLVGALTGLVKDVVSPVTTLMDWETGLAKFKALGDASTGMSGDEYDSFLRDVTDISNETGFSTNEILGAAYSNASGGTAGSRDEQLAVLTSEAMLARGGSMSMEDAGGAITPLVKLGLDPRTAANTLLGTYTVGNYQSAANVADFSTKSYAAGISGGVPVEQVGAALATVSGVANPANTETYVSAYLNELKNPSSKAYAAMQKAFKGTAYEGMNLESAIGNGATLADISGMIWDWGDKNRDKAGNMPDLTSSIQTSGIALQTIAENRADTNAYAQRIGSEDFLTYATGVNENTFAARLQKAGANLYNNTFGAMMTSTANNPNGVGDWNAQAGLMGGWGFTSPTGFGGASSVGGGSMMGGGGRGASIGDSGAGVQTIQAMLSSLGISLGSAGIDGKFGKDTEGAVKEFQKGHGLEETGKVDAKTMQALAEASESAASSTESVGDAMESAGTAASNAATQMDTVGAASSTAGASLTSVGSASSEAAASFGTVKGKTSALATALSSVASAIKSKASQISSIRISAPSGGSGDGNAVGMDNVPYDGYRTFLHKGEAVLNRAEASAWRTYGIGNAAASSNVDTEAIARAMSNVVINMDGKRVGKMTAAPVGHEMARNLNRAQRKG